MKKILVTILAGAFALSLSGVCGATGANEEKEKIEPKPVSFQVGAGTAVEAVKQNPVSLPDWWDMTIDLVGNMALKALKSGNLNVTLTDGGVPGAFIAVYQSENINVIWGLNREGKFIGIEPAKPLPYQENLAVDELKNMRPQLLYDYENKRIGFAVEYDFRAE